MTFSEIKEHGNLDRFDTGSNHLVCADGFMLSVIAGAGAHTTPRNDSGPYLAVEMGYPSERPEPWAEWEKYAERSDDPTGTVYGFVPTGMIEALIALHGGEVQ